MPDRPAPTIRTSKCSGVMLQLYSAAVAGQQEKSLRSAVATARQRMAGPPGGPLTESAPREPHSENCMKIWPLVLAALLSAPSFAAEKAEPPEQVVRYDRYHIDTVLNEDGSNVRTYDWA